MTEALSADTRRDNNQVVGCAGALFFWGINDNQLKVMPPLLLCCEVPLQYMFTCRLSPSSPFYGDYGPNLTLLIKRALVGFTKEQN